MNEVLSPAESASATRRCSLCGRRKPLSDFDIPGYPYLVRSCKRCRLGDLDRARRKLTKLTDVEARERVAELSVQLRREGGQPWKGAWRKYFPPPETWSGGEPGAQL